MWGEGGGSDATGGGGGGGERSRHHTIVLPAEGVYWLEVLYDSEGYTGFLDRGEGLKLPERKLKQLEPVRTVINPWLDVPAACFMKRIPTSSPGCDCDDARRRRPLRYQSWPGYWAEDRTEYVPFFRPQATRWVPRSDGVQSPAARHLLRRVPGGLLVTGTSRQRAVYLDILRILSHSVREVLGWAGKGWAGNASAAHDWQHALPAHWFEQRPETKVGFFQSKLGLALHANASEVGYNNGTVDEGRTDYLQSFFTYLDMANLCTAASRRSFVIFSDGAHFVARVHGPHGLAKSARVVNDTLTALARRCKGTQTTLMVASEMAVHDHWGADQAGNSFRDNRIRGFNAALEDMADSLGLHFLDVYLISLSAGQRSDNRRRFNSDPHHYDVGPLVGDIVSMTVASALLDAVASALDSSAPGQLQCAIEIVEPVDGHGVVLGSSASDARLWRNISVIVSASPECKDATMSVTVSVDGMLLGNQELAADSAGGSMSMMTAKLGEGTHVISVASDGPYGLLERVSAFNVFPYSWSGYAGEARAWQAHDAAAESKGDGGAAVDDDEDVEICRNKNESGR